MSPSSDFVPNNILVTGGAGFIGSHVANLLAREHPEYTVIVYDSLEYCASLDNLDQHLPNLTCIEGNILDAHAVTAALHVHAIDTVLHFAAQSHVDQSFGNSLTFTTHNCVGTHMVLECCRAYGKLRRLVYVSSDEVTGSTSEGVVEGLTEEATMNPTNPYAASKAAAEMIVKSYMTSFGLPCVITRGNNVFGPGQYPEKLVPKAIVLALRGLPIPLHGDGSALRSYLHVDDVAAAFDVILHRGVTGHTYNIGSQEERAARQVAEDIVGFTRSSAGIVHVRDRCFNDRRYFISDKKLTELGWRPLKAWDDGLRETIAWYANLLHVDGQEQSDGLQEHWPRGDLGEAMKAHPADDAVS